MAIIKSGNELDGMWEVDPTSKALIGSVRGQEFGNGGYYRSSLTSGTITARAAGDILWAFQNPPTSPNLALVMGVGPGIRAVAGAATSSSFVLSLYFTRSYTVLDTTGALAAVSFKGQMVTQTRASQQNSLYRITSTTAMTGGTGTNDSQPMASLVFTHPGIVSTLSAQSFVPPSMGGLSMPQYPIVLAPGEGLRIRTDQAWTAGNTAVLYVDVSWVETSSY